MYYKQQRINRFTPGSEIAIYLACNRNSIMKIGDFLFVHGGLVPAKAKQYSLEKINDTIRQYLLGNKSKKDVDVNNLIVGKDSPFWSRHYSNSFSGNSKKACQSLSETIEYIKLKGMIVGHTVQSKGINSGCDGKIWRTDIGLSRSFGKRKHRVQVLEIIDNGKLINILE